MKVEPVYHATPDGGQGLLAVVFYAGKGDWKDGVDFMTAASLPMQVGFMKHKAGTETKAHVHTAWERNVTGTPEVLYIVEGSVSVDLYLSTGEL